jgi:membrane-bound lytic murein transglycosylase B
MAGFANFEVVTRYNRSTFYASAVLELADAIEKAHNRVQLASAR